MPKQIIRLEDTVDIHDGIENIELCIITNKYGKFLSYNLSSFNDGYECLSYQVDITKLIESKDYDVFVDIGAYIGFFSVIASNFCKKVITYEANPWFFGLTLDNMKFLPNVECRYCWVSNNGDIPIIGTSFQMVGNTTDPNYKKYNVPVVTIDDELIPLKDEKMLIKMDIEGSEEKALQGASEIIKQSNIHWFIDVHEPNIKVENIMNFFQDREIIRIADTLTIKGKKGD